VKFLPYQNLSPRLAELLTTADHSAQHIREMGLKRLASQSARERSRQSATSASPAAHLPMARTAPAASPGAHTSPRASDATDRTLPEFCARDALENGRDRTPTAAVAFSTDRD
jgi:hypothetical protein